MEISFKGKRALVTGAGKGIGRDVAKTLVHCGADVVALSRTQSDLDSLQNEVPSIKTVCLDVTDIEGVRKVIQDLDSIHLLVNNAGVPSQEPFLEIKPDSFDRIYDTNLKGALFTAQAVARKMVANGYSGSIVNVSSNLSKKGIPNVSVYSSAKAALDQLTKVMALELGQHKIRVNAVNPGFTWTPMLREGMKVRQEMLKALIAQYPLGRAAETDEVVNAILFLLSDQASMIHGVTLPVDGGWLVN